MNPSNPSNPSLGGGLTGSESVLSGSGLVQSNMHKFGESGSGADGFVQSNMPLETQLAYTLCITGYSEQSTCIAVFCETFLKLLRTSEELRSKLRCDTG